MARTRESEEKREILADKRKCRNTIIGRNYIIKGERKVYPQTPRDEGKAKAKGKRDL